MTGSLLDAAREKQRAALEGRFAALIEDQVAAIEQQNHTKSAVEIERLQREINSLQKEIEQVDSTIKRLNSGMPDYNQRCREWDANLPHIDFKRAFTTFQSTFREIEKGGSTLFILQNSNSKGGKWCVDRIRSHLKEGTGDFKSYPIGFSSNTRSYIFDFLRGLDSHIHINSEPIFADENQPNLEELNRYTKVIISTLCGSLRSGSIVFIELKQCDYFWRQNQFIAWFMDDFWASLTNRIDEIIRDYPRVKVITLMVVDGKIVPEHLPATLCVSKGKLDSKKIVELPLQNWTRSDLQDWLEKYSGLSRLDIREKVEIIYNASDGGRPTLVYHALMEHL